MSSDLQLALLIKFNGRAATDGLRKLNTDIRTTFDAGSRHAGKFTNSMMALGKQTRQVLADFNGFSAASKLLAAAGGIQLFRETLNKNLNFERDLIEIKQMAGMTMKQANELRAIAMNSAQDTLQTPDEMLQGIKAFARAGTKFDEIKDKIQEAGKAATVFRATAEEIANMDFDMTDKLKIDASRMPAVHNMLYYHGNSGRFEAGQLAKQAPTLFNAVANVGVGGERGLNFTGALTQVLMKSASVSDPGMVSTLMQQGLGHITSPHYVKGLAKAGIDVKKYAPGGKFYGEGGADGLLDLADAMKAKGLQDPFKLSEAGFADQETLKFFRGLMQHGDSIRTEMKNADAASKRGQISIDLAEMKQANFGKIKAAEIEIEKMKLSEPAQKGTSWSGDIAKNFSENSGDYIKGGLAVAGAGLAWRYNRNKKRRLAAEGGTEGGAFDGAGFGANKVFVTNWPKGLLGPGEDLKQKRNNRESGGGGGFSGSATGPTKKQRFLNGLKGSAKLGGLFSVGMGLVEAGDIALDSSMNATEKKQAYAKTAGGTTGGVAGAAIGGGIGAVFGGVGAIPGAMIGGVIGNIIGEKIAKWMMQPAPVVIQNNMVVDGKQLAASVNTINSRQATRK